MIIKNKQGLILFLLPALTGCSVLTSYAEKQIKQAAALEELPEYQEFENYVQAKKIDEEGNRLEKEPEEQVTVEDIGSIHVTIGTNNHINLSFYTDEERLNLISDNNCYLNPGDSVFTSEPILNAYTNTYTFDGFRIYSYDSDNNRQEINVKPGENGLVYRIPDNYSGNKLSIMPLGAYENRVLTFNSSYTDSEGIHQLGGNWDANGIIADANHQVTLSSVTPYVVRYDFSNYKEDYYFEKSVPLSFKADDEMGIVEFYQADPLDENFEYSVELKPYKTLTVNNKNFLSANNIKSFAINTAQRPIPQKNNEKIKKIKPGDIITICVSPEYKVTGTGISVSPPVNIAQGAEYTAIVQNTLSDQLTLVISKKNAKDGEYTQKTISNGSLILTRSDGSVIADGDEMDAKEKITVSILPNQDFYITGSGVKENAYEKTMTYESYLKDIDKIIEKHEIKKYIHVTFNSEDRYGTCEYKQGKTVLNGPVSLKEGDNIKLTYTLLDNNYVIKGDNAVTDFFHSTIGSNTTTANIKITPELDNKTVSRDQYIVIEPKK